MINPSAYEAFLDATGLVIFYIALLSIRWTNLNRYTHVGEVYRGTRMDDTDIHRRFPNVGEVYQDKAFTSTSTDEAVAFNEFSKGNVKITAQTKSGIKDDSFSATGGENEVLFKSDKKFESTKKVLLSDGKTWDIHLKEL